ncbi:reverse transcriptase domain-containing protein [Tanacetum coccineum]
MEPVPIAVHRRLDILEKAVGDGACCEMRDRVRMCLPIIVDNAMPMMWQGDVMNISFKTGCGSYRRTPSVETDRQAAVKIYFRPVSSKFEYVEVLLGDVYGKIEGKAMCAMIKASLVELYEDYVRIHASPETHTMFESVDASSSMNKHSKTPVIEPSIILKQKVRHHGNEQEKSESGMHDSQVHKVNDDGLKVFQKSRSGSSARLSPKCLKDVQRLNGKLASLNRFLSKSAKKPLPFFKTLKKYTKKSDFQWTAKAKTAFKQMKKLIAELPMLTALKEKEELIIYLAAAKESISAVLMTEKDGKQVSIYFVSHALQGPEINYTPMEKLKLALVTGRLLKWSFELEEHDIHYRPRTSVKGQILADFIVKRLKDDPLDTPMEDEEELPNL